MKGPKSNWEHNTSIGGIKEQKLLRALTKIPVSSTVTFNMLLNQILIISLCGDEGKRGQLNHVKGVFYGQSRLLIQIFSKKIFRG